MRSIYTVTHNLVQNKGENIARIKLIQIFLGSPLQAFHKIYVLKNIVKLIDDGALFSIKKDSRRVFLDNLWVKLLFGVFRCLIYLFFLFTTMILFLFWLGGGEGLRWVESKISPSGKFSKLFCFFFVLFFFYLWFLDF